MRTPVPIPETKPATELIDEWRHEFRALGRPFASLVPDVAYLSRDALDALGPSAAESPPRAPDVAVEILSRGESERDLAWKVDAYLRAGTLVVFVVDPPQRAVIAHDLGGSVRFGSGESVRHPALPGFAYAIEVMFEGLYLGD